MAVEGVTANGRTYQRKFDYAEAAAMREAGLTFSEIGRRLGVSHERVRQVLIPEVGAKVAASARAHSRGVCRCGTEIWTNGGRTRCHPCASKDLTTTVRDGELRCSRCHEWKPDAAFPHHRNEPTHRGRHRVCRACQTLMKREWRAKRRAAGKAAP